MEKNRETKIKFFINSVYHNLFPVFIICVLVVIFFARLFYPKTSLFMIPDFGESDVLHFNLPLKEILSVSLKNKEWPLWNSNLASGFPILAEGQIGTFYLPNLILFRFFETIPAYNLNLVIAYLLSCFGIFLFAESLKISRISSLFSAVIFTFSGFLSVHLNHFNLIQAVSVLPFLFWAANLILKKPSVRYAILFSFFLSQQVFTGHFYIVFISLLGVTVFFLGSIALDKHYKIYKNSKKLFKKSVLSSRPILSLSIESGGFTLKAHPEGIFHIPKVGRFLDPDLIGARNDTFQKGSKRIGYFVLGCFLGFFLSAIQLFPSIELGRMSARSNGLSFDTVTSYPYPVKHLVTFIKPYFLGNPADASYPSFDANWGIFWENTAYVGILPLILALSSIFFLVPTSSQFDAKQASEILKKKVKVFLFLLAISLLLVLGKYSPFYFVFSFPPFNFFRVPSKFLLLTTFSLAILSGYTFDQLIRWFNKSTKSILSQTHAIAVICEGRKILGIGVRGMITNFILVVFFLLILVDEYRFSYQYPPVSLSTRWTQIPESARFLVGKEGRITSIGAPLVWNSVFLKKGWQDISPFVYFRNSLYPNYNALYSLSQTDVNTGGLIPQRTALASSMAKIFEIDDQRKIATLSAITLNHLSLSSSSYFVSPYEIKQSDLLMSQKISSPDNLQLPSFYIYKNKKALPRIYISFKTKQIFTLEDLTRELQRKDFLLENMTLVEDGNFLLKSQDPGKGKAAILSEKNTEIRLISQSDKDGILILTDSHYPGWTSLIDGKLTTIKNVNLTQRGILLPKGEHIIHFIFKPFYFHLGKTITILTMITVSLAVFLCRGFFPQKASGKKKPSLRL